MCSLPSGAVRRPRGECACSYDDVVARENVDPHFRDESPRDCGAFCRGIAEACARADCDAAMAQMESLALFLKNFSPSDEFYGCFVDGGVGETLCAIIRDGACCELFNQTVWCLYWVFCSAIYERRYAAVDFLLEGAGLTALVIAQRGFPGADMFYYYALMAKMCCVSVVARDTILDSFSAEDFERELSGMLEEDFDINDGFSVIKGLGMLIKSLTVFELDKERYVDFIKWIVQYFANYFAKMPDYLIYHFLSAICNVCCYDDDMYITAFINKQKYQCLIEEILIKYKENKNYPDIVSNALFLATLMVETPNSNVCFDNQLIMSISSSTNSEHAVLGFKLISKIVLRSKSISSYNTTQMINHLSYSIQNRPFEVRKSVLSCVNAIITTADFNEIIPFGKLIPSLVEYFQCIDDKKLKIRILDIFYRFLFSGQISGQCNFFKDTFCESNGLELIMSLIDDEDYGEKAQELSNEFFPEELE